MLIPGQKVGLIIGKGGETIRNLQDKSGTKMFILQENMFEECDKPLRIVGSPDLVEVRFKMCCRAEVICELAYMLTFCTLICGFSTQNNLFLN